MTDLNPKDIREARAADPKFRDRDLAERLQISEAQLVAAHVGFGATAVVAHPDQIMHAAATFGETMALTRNVSCVHEKIGVYDNYHPGSHAAMVLTEDIDLRIFPNHWRHAYMVETETDAGLRRSLQVFDAAGDAVHKIFLRGDDVEAPWAEARAQIALRDQDATLTVEPRQPPEAPKSDPGKLDILRKEWVRMTDTHQFLRLASKLKMNRLGAYRIAGTPFVRALPPRAVNAMFEAVRDRQIDIMLFVGNRGCIQIHTGPIGTLKPMGPWQNVMDSRFNLHLRGDHVAEVWAVEKPTQRGPAVSVEAFDARGMLIFQVFGLGKEGRDTRPAWREIVDDLPSLEVEAAQ